MDGKDDNVKEDADGVDDQGQEDGVLAGKSNPGLWPWSFKDNDGTTMGPVWESNAPDESAKEQQVVDDICLQ